MILELMYYGEAILIDPDVYDPDYSAWLYVKRVKTGTVGWMEWSYLLSPPFAAPFRNGLRVTLLLAESRIE